MTNTTINFDNIYKNIEEEIALLNKKMEIIKAFEFMVYMFENREKFVFDTYTSTCGLWSGYYNKTNSIWSCGEIVFPEVRHYRDMYKIMNDKPIKDNQIEKLTKAVNFLNREIKNNREFTMNILYRLEA